MKTFIYFSSGNYFNNMPAVQPTFEQIIEIFGITSPGCEYSNKLNVYIWWFGRNKVE